MNQLSFVFSLVLYNHSLQDIRPLINSLHNLHLSSSDLEIALFVYDGSPRLTDPDLYSLFCDLGHSFPVSYCHGENIGYGRSNNSNFRRSSYLNFMHFVVVNPDISFEVDDLTPLLRMLPHRPSLSCVAPLIVDSNGFIQYSAKRNPTFLSLLLGKLAFLRVIPFLQSYYFDHLNLGRNYNHEEISASYLSGCFLIIPSYFYRIVGGFDSRYFLHIEDADIVRMLSLVGDTCHSPCGKVVHRWARGSHRSITQMFYLISSYLKYSFKWGCQLF